MGIVSPSSYTKLDCSPNVKSKAKKLFGKSVRDISFHWVDIDCYEVWH
ncbi:hypothetical protein [Helicobacter japonicus]|nr:hypothetical protein [Helicobacter japonicus]